MYGTGDRRGPGPQGHHEGDRVACGPRSAPRPARGEYNASALGHCVGGKVAVTTNCAHVLQSGHGSKAACGW